MNKSFKSIMTLSLLVLVISFAVYLNEPSPSTISGKQCEIDDSLVCHFNWQNNDVEQVIVKFDKKVQVEELNDIVLTLPRTATLESVWIQGVNMYMGKVAVIEQMSSDNQNHNMQFFLGSCSEPEMRWQLVIEIKQASDQQSETYFINFKTTI